MSLRPDDELPIDPRKLRADPDFRVPDLTEAVEGWRAWGVPQQTPRYDAMPKLYSVTHGAYFWVPKQKMEAYCRKCSPKGQVPGEQCSCGFYSAKTLEHLTGMTYHLYDAENGGYFHVIGVVANTGAVIEGSQGWRSQFSYPVRLYIPYEAHYLGPALSQTYGVPVQLKNILGIGRPPVFTRRQSTPPQGGSS